MQKVLWFDTETTGLDPAKNDIIQIAGLIEIDGEIKEEFNLKCAPFCPDNVSGEALQVHGYTLKEIQEWPDPKRISLQFRTILDSWVDKYDRADKMIPAGHNVRFDIEFLNYWFKKGGDKYGIGSYMSWQPLDTMYMAVIMKYLKRLSSPSMKLEDLAKALGIEPGGHDALADIKATRGIGLKMLGMME